MTGLVVLLGLPGLLGSCDSGSTAAPQRPRPAPSSASPDQAFPDPQKAHLVGRVRVGGSACGVVVAAGRVWVTSYADDTVVSVDPGSGKVLSRTAVGDRPCGLAYGDGSIWVENFGSYDVTRVDAETGKREATVDVGFSPYDVVFADHAAWVTNNGSGTVSRIDAATGHESQVETGGRPTGIAVAGDRVWVALGARGLVAIDPRTSEVTTRLHTDGATGWTASTDHRLWVTEGDAVDLVDPATAELVGTVPVPEGPADASAAGSTAYVPIRHTGQVAVVDGDEVTQVLDVGVRDPFVVAVAGRMLWVADYGGSDLVGVRLDR